MYQRHCNVLLFKEKCNHIINIPHFAAKPEEEKCRNPCPFYYPMIIEKTKKN